ncbi:tRNA lysidine(34) synthetase TilS [Arenimonas composti]|uniref:tRNA(Ile)-lysidine synthase n=1 Tax=Arenimonas composti TR7-09 = DSM 18010 TaxID=1121013 RepID=A0A091BD26_9GAMM|nr:tRNA lysidine(34) synthetase TilS [Arenimonas composti]KFN49641.1 hypothetical protein P873_09750 [Arenimonas composti TR7-09 = DSM 18010]
MTVMLPPAPGEHGIAVAFSGGLDSTVLLHLLAGDPAARARGLRALHVDHGLHADSAAWAEHCAGICAALGVDFASRRVGVVATGEGLEAAARRARHGALVAMQRPGEVIALAHHRDDQAETVLLRLLRGAGDGLAGMRVLRPFGSGALWRPLLAVARSDIEAWARARDLAWLDDPANDALRHDRNFLRHEILPRLATRWPQASAALARSAALLATQADLLGGEDAQRLAALRGGDPAWLDLAGLRALVPEWRARVLRAWLAALGLPPAPAARLATIGHDLVAAQAADGNAAADGADGGDAGDSGDGGLVEWPGAQVRRWRGRLWAGPPPVTLPADFETRWDGRAPLPLPTGVTLALVGPGTAPPACFPEPLCVRARRGGERLRLPGRSHSHALKHLLQDAGVPPWERAALPLLFAADGELLAAGDRLVSARLQAWLGRNGLALVIINGVGDSSAENGL